MFRFPQVGSAIVVLILVTVASPVRSEVTRVVIERRENVLGGKAFGEAGAYEKLAGYIHFAFDPDNPFNARIVDLKLAPRNADGLVEARANFMVLMPKDPKKSRGTAYVEVSNRGGKATLRYFQNASGRGSDPVTEEHFGDGLLMNMGMTIIWIGWQCDVPDEPGRLRLNVPIATNPDGSPIEGLVRSDWVVNEPIATLHVGHRNHIAYPVLDPNDPLNRLTQRSGRLETRFVIARDQWRFAIPGAKGPTEDRTHILLEGGFKPEFIYELVYRAANPRIVGLGLAAIRDIASYVKYDESCPFPAQRAITFGVSQTGRFLRHFLYQGFNTDEQNRKVYDGMLIHSAGAGRGSFNHRFAQPSRDAHRYSAFFYPTDIFPFTSRTQYDPETKREDGQFAHAFDESHLPKVFYTNTGYEYWGRAASLIHTSVDGEQDIEPADNERIYHLASGQHFVSRFPPVDASRISETNAYRGNPLDFLVTLRALLVRLTEWVDDNESPPPSQFPHVSNNTLVGIEEVVFPKIPGVTFPTVIHKAYRADYGPRWEQGIVSIQPPRLGNVFRTQVSQVNELGNEIGGVKTVEIMAPLATYAPWNLRHDAPSNQHELTDFYGTYIPLARNENERAATGDPRPSLELRYQTRERYLDIAARAADMLMKQGLLLPQDRQRVLDRAAAHWDWIQDH